MRKYTKYEDGVPKYSVMANSNAEAQRKIFAIDANEAARRGQYIQVEERSKRTGKVRRRYTMMGNPFSVNIDDILG